MCVCPTVRCPSISKKPVEICGGGLFGASQTDSKEGNFFSRYQMPLYRQGNKYVKIGESFTKQNVQSTEHFESLG